MKVIKNTNFKKQLDYLFEHYKLLCSNKLDTENEFILYKNNLDSLNNPFILRKSSNDYIELIISSINHLGMDDSQTYFNLFFPEQDFINRIDLYWKYLEILFNCSYFMSCGSFKSSTLDNEYEWLSTTNIWIKFISYYNNLPEYYNMVDLRNISKIEELKIPNIEDIYFISQLQNPYKENNNQWDVYQNYLTIIQSNLNNIQIDEFIQPDEYHYIINIIIDEKHINCYNIPNNYYSILKIKK